MYIEFLFCTVVNQILNGALTRDNLDEQLAQQIENIAFEHFKPKQKVGGSHLLSVVGISEVTNSFFFDFF